ncbi:Uncharacterised protein [uncultured archaeon]|nr:Uncharacterised protein [uncultured archaeon]
MHGDAFYAECLLEFLGCIVDRADYVVIESLRVLVKPAYLNRHLVLLCHAVYPLKNVLGRNDAKRLVAGQHNEIGDFALYHQHRRVLHSVLLADGHYVRSGVARHRLIFLCFRSLNNAPFPPFAFLWLERKCRQVKGGEKADRPAAARDQDVFCLAFLHLRLRFADAFALFDAVNRAAHDVLDRKFRDRAQIKKRPEYLHAGDYANRLA